MGNTPGIGKGRNIISRMQTSLQKQVDKFDAALANLESKPVFRPVKEKCAKLETKVNEKGYLDMLNDENKKEKTNPNENYGGVAGGIEM